VERRNDRWIKGVMLRENKQEVKKDEEVNEKIIKAEKENEQANFLVNPVHGNMEQHEIDKYIANTRIKTVEFL
jgi:hypothetical protein